MALGVKPYHESAGDSGVLREATQGGNYRLVKFLLDNFPELELDFPLRIACNGGHLEVVRMLLAQGADPNFKCYSSERWRALDHAVGSGNIEIVKLLIRSGAEVYRGNPHLWRRTRKLRES